MLRPCANCSNTRCWPALPTRSTRWTRRWSGWPGASWPGQASCIRTGAWYAKKRRAQPCAPCCKPGAHWPPHPARLGFTLLGLVALADPLRAGIPEAVRALRAADIRVLMITGDYPSTAQAIARQARLAEGTLLTGDALAAMTARELRACIAGMALLPLLLGWPVLLPMHIVFLELMIDPACTLAFENHGPDPDSMRAPPRAPDAPLVGGAALLRAGLHGIVALAHVIAAWLWASGALAPEAARAFAFTALVGANLALMFAHAARRQPNPMLWMIATGTLAALLAVIYLPALAAVFHFAPLSVAQLLAGAGAGLSLAVWSLLLKLAQRLR
ncbi:cation-translocating P-type ATPase [Massilia sp. DJPM01]|uniref:cation transporting ATPase C-terminal domain-containing protein n=1 Tax=Massilia sp. DJPM01 TaxID=3024404 RepID=UPI00259E4929|nr:cation-translocating P-type ATPase [Massilia sp. DJPM01]MDM5177027.1 cation-translocating P-type ATPase [Massilia sp. DJPM01]